MRTLATHENNAGSTDRNGAANLTRDGCDAPEYRPYGS
jgi:hypothetical protein